MDVQSWQKLKEADVICIVQTCFPTDGSFSFPLEGFLDHYVSAGNGKGIALYYKSTFQHREDFSDTHLQVSKVSSAEVDVITVYRSSVNNLEQCAAVVASFIDLEKETVILGDFNVSFMEENALRSKLYGLGYKQLLDSATFYLGTRIDHCYVQTKSESSYTVAIDFLYWTDHAAVFLTYNCHGNL